MIFTEPPGFWAFFTSRWFVVSLLILLIFFSLLGVLIPQEVFTPQPDFIKWSYTYPLMSKMCIFLGVTRTFTHPVYITVVGLLTISLAVCSCNRTVGFIKRNELDEEVALHKDKFFNKYFELNFQNFQTNFIEEKLKKQGFNVTKLIIGKTYSFIADKGKCGRWGSVFFHLSFVVLLFGALTSIWTRFEGKILLTEGQYFHGFHSEYTDKNEPPLGGADSLGFKLELSKFHPSIDQKKSFSRDQVIITEKGGRKLIKNIRKYHALTHKRYTFYQQEHGFSPSFSLNRKNGEKIFQSFVAFSTKRGGEGFLFEDIFEIPGTDIKIYGRLYPDATIKEDFIESKSNTPGHPIISIKATRQNKEIYRGHIPINEQVEFDDYTLSFDDLRYWSSFRVVRDYGIPVLYFGFFIGIIGLLIRLFLNHQVILIEIENNKDGYSSVRIFGKAEREKALFVEKMNKLVDELKNFEGVR